MEPEKYNFHEISLQSSLFKGRPDLYFCYLKSEKIAHALVRLFKNTSGESYFLAESLLHSSVYLPSAIGRFAAGELEEASLMSDIFDILSSLRLSVSYELLEEKNAQMLIAEFEGIAEKIALRKNASPFLALEDLAVPPLLMSPAARIDFAAAGREGEKGQKKDTSTRPLYKGQIIKDNSKGQNERSTLIISVIKDKKKVSIKDISKIIRNCSEKTIQRELAILVRQGLVRKEGERRWSFYTLAS